MAIVQLEILHLIEKATGKKITELFHWIVASGIGGLLMLVMIYGKLCYNFTATLGQLYIVHVVESFGWLQLLFFVNYVFQSGCIVFSFFSCRAKEHSRVASLLLQASRQSVCPPTG